MDHVPLVDEDRLDPARLLGGHVHLDRLDPPIARGKSGRQRVESGLVGLPTEDPAPGEDGEHEDPERSPLHRGRSRGSVELTTLSMRCREAPHIIRRHSKASKGQVAPGQCLARQGTAVYGSISRWLLETKRMTIPLTRRVAMPNSQSDGNPKLRSVSGIACRQGGRRQNTSVAGSPHPATALAIRTSRRPSVSSAATPPLSPRTSMVTWGPADSWSLRHRFTGSSA